LKVIKAIIIKLSPETMRWKAFYKTHVG